MAYTESVSLRARLPANDGTIEPSEDDANLMLRMVDADERALGEVFDRYSPNVYAICLRVLRAQSDAEDVMQEVFLELWRRPGRFDARRGSLRVYLAQLARSRSIDRLRQHRRRSEVMREASGELEVEASATMPRSPDGSASDSEQRHAVAAALSSLPDPQRTALVLSYFDGLSYREIAEQSGEPVGTIKTRVRRALLRLREHLASWSEMEPPGEDEE